MKINLFHLYLTLFLFLACGDIHAREHVVQGYVVDNITGDGIGNAEVTLMTTDSVPLDSCCTHLSPDDYIINGLFNELRVTKTGNYIICVKADGYETEYIDIRLRSDREDYVSVPTFYMVKKRTVSLKEVVVKASKIKMVVKGDTITYNADAFKLEEGSMLSALIEKLPGAKLTEDGEIYVNGRYIQELLVNGKEFFMGNPRVALENLPSYTVDKINVYSKRGQASAMMNSDLDDRTYVMDVRLKKEYSTGVIANMEGAGGTNKRYSLKGMAMRYTDNTRLVAYGNLNNLNDKDKVNSIGEWNAEKLSTGRLTNHEAGFSYLNFLGNQNSYISSSNTYANKIIDNETYTNNQMFLTGGDAFKKTVDNSRFYSMTLSSLNSLTLWRDSHFLNSSINFNYIKNNNNGYGTQESLRNDSLLNYLLTRDRRNSSTYTLSTKLNGGLHCIADLLRYGLRFDYQKAKSQDFSLYDLKYHNIEEGEYRNNYWNSPVSKISAMGEVGYDICNIGFLSYVSPLYTYNYNRTNCSNSLYRLDMLADRDSTAFDILPSAYDNLKAVVDQGNSYNSIENIHTHTALLRFGGQNSSIFKTDDSGHWILDLPIRIINGLLDYHRLVDYQIKRKAVFFEPKFSINQYSNINWTFEAKMHSSLPDLTQCVDFVDTSNPLYLRMGNSDLKNIHYFDVSGSWGKISQRELQINSQLAFHAIDNAVAYSCLYDPVLGVSTIKPVNVNGNWNFEGYFGVYSPLGKKRQFTIQNEIKPSYYHNVDMAQIEGIKNGMRSIVHNTSLTDEFRFEYKPKDDFLFTALAQGTWNHITSDRPDFNTINIANFSYGIKAQMLLPWKMNFKTSLIDYAHRGFDQREMNTDEIVWNAYMAKSLLHGKLIVGVKANDILGQIKSRTYVIDAQGRTETTSNVVPRYVLFSVTWKFHKSPKARK